MNFSSSLVKYSTPVLISTGVRKEGKEARGKGKGSYYDKKESDVDKTTRVLSWIEDMADTQTIEEILNAILPPREFHLEAQGQVWIQTALSVPATRNEVAQLQGRANYDPR